MAWATEAICCLPSWKAASAASASAEALLAVAVAAFRAIWASLRSSPAICAFWVAVAAVALTSASLTSISATLIEAASSAALAAAISSSEGAACAICGKISRALAAKTVRAVRIVPRCLIVVSSRTCVGGRP